MSVFGVKSMALNMRSDWSKVREVDDQRETQRQRRVNTWCKPPLQWIKINIDAACDTEGGLIGLGCVIRDDTDNLFELEAGGYRPYVNQELQKR